MKKFPKGKSVGTFLLPNGKEYIGVLEKAGRSSSLLITSSDDLQGMALGDRCITGILSDHLTKVSLHRCITLSNGSYHSGAETVHRLKLFPHAVVYGDSHLRPTEENIKAISFVLSDAHVLFDDRQAFGRVFGAGEQLRRMLEAEGNSRARLVSIGEDPHVMYFTGREDIAIAETAIGKVKIKHRPSFGSTSSKGVGIRSKVLTKIEFDRPLRYEEAVMRAQDVIRFCGLLIGRRQETKGYGLTMVEDGSAFPHLEVYETMRNTDRSSFSTEEPFSYDTLIDGVENSAEFAQTLVAWIARQADWREARNRFFYTFFRRQSVTPDRLINSANLFDCLPDTAFPSRPELPEALLSAVDRARAEFRNLSASFERDSVLQALGRVKSPNLKFKIQHRAKKLIDFCPGYEKLPLVISEAVECRNYFVHGGKPRLPYYEKFFLVDFFICTLEYIFAASDLIESGWDFSRWHNKHTSMTHPFGYYKIEFPKLLRELEAAVSA